MRTTLKIDDDVLEAARSLAEQQGRTIGEVISDLARKALRPRPSRRSRSGFPVFDVSRDAAPLSTGMVDEALEDPE